jgi:hypothetical protein
MGNRLQTALDEIRRGESSFTAKDYCGQREWSTTTFTRFSFVFLPVLNSLYRAVYDKVHGAAKPN